MIAALSRRDPQPPTEVAGGGAGIPVRTRGRTARTDPFLRTRETGPTQRLSPGCAGIEETIEQLIRMNLASLRGYQEIADLASDAETKSFAEVMLRQRSAQCRELILCSSGLRESRLEEPAAATLRLLWIRASWRLEQDERAAAFEEIANAEELLEEACLQAAALYPECPISALLASHATSICGARQRLDGGNPCG